MKSFNLLRHLSKRIFNKQQKTYTIKSGEEENPVPSYFIRQCCAASGPLLLTVIVGMTLGYSAILLPQLELNFTLNATAPSIKINQEQASWLASLAVIPMAIGTLIGGFLIEKFGRKMTHIILCLPYCFGWTLMGLSQNIEMLLTSRFITGFSAGILAPATGVYIGEIAEPKYRGTLLGGIALSVAVGLLLVHLLGTLLTWNLTALITSALPIISWIVLYFAPESPIWLAKQKNNKEKAEKSFMWLRGDSEASKQELHLILSSTNHQAANFQLKDLLVAEFLKPMAILLVFFITTQWAGANAVNFYSVTFMKKTLGSTFNEYLLTIIVDCIRVVSSITLCVLLRRHRRRPLTLTYSVGTILPLFALALFIYLSRVNSQLSDIPALQIIPLVSIIIYITFVTGFAALPWSLIGELFPVATGRSSGSGIVSCVAYLSIFGVVKTMPGMFERLGVDGTFLVYGIVALVGTVFIMFYLPETKGKTLNEVEAYFKEKIYEEKSGHKVKVERF